MRKNRKIKQGILFSGVALFICLSAGGLVLFLAQQEIPALGEGDGVPSSSRTSLEEVSSETGALEDVSSGTGASSGMGSLPERVSSAESAPPASHVIPGSEDLSFTPGEQSALDELLRSYGEYVSVYFQDVASGAVYEFNADRHYFVASLIKAPYCMYLYQMAEKGEFSLEELLTVSEEDKQEGTGVLKDREDLPQDFTVRELIALAIRESDNTAMKVLLRRFPAPGYREYIEALGLPHPDDVSYVVDGQISAHDAGFYLTKIYDYIEHGQYGGELKSDMMNTKYPLIRSEYPMARKYGWMAKEGRESYHDMAIVYAPHPYLLAICTDHKDGTDEDRALFGEISRYLEKLWAEKYAALEV